MSKDKQQGAAKFHTFEQLRESLQREINQHKIEAIDQSIYKKTEDEIILLKKIKSELKNK